MRPIVHHSATVAELAALDAVDLDLEGWPRPNRRFLAEVERARERTGLGFREAAWHVLAARARKAGRTVNVDALTAMMVGLAGAGAP